MPDLLPAGGRQLPWLGRHLVASATRRRPHRWRRALMLTVVMVVAVGADWLTGPDVSLLAGYAAATGYASWTLGTPMGVTAATVSGLGAASVGIWHPHAHGAVDIVVANSALRTLVLVLLAGALSLLRDTTAALHGAAHTDPLTGLHNRRSLYQHAEQERARTARFGRPLAVAYIDLDDLKRVNDQEGHEAGDATIRRFATALRAGLRAEDLVARIGGDEFLAVLPDTTADGARALFQRLLDRPGIPPASVGIAAWTRSCPPVEEMVAAADAIMYQAKQRHDRVPIAVTLT